VLYSLTVTNTALDAFDAQVDHIEQSGLLLQNEHSGIVVTRLFYNPFAEVIFVRHHYLLIQEEFLPWNLTSLAVIIWLLLVLFLQSLELSTPNLPQDLF